MAIEKNVFGKKVKRLSLDLGSQTLTLLIWGRSQEERCFCKYVEGRFEDFSQMGIESEILKKLFRSS